MTQEKVYIDMVVINITLKPRKIKYAVLIADTATFFYVGNISEKENLIPK